MSAMDTPNAQLRDAGTRDAHIRIEGVSKSYGALAVLNRCSITVARGTVLTLLGPSGCGKTTLLRTIAGFVEPDEGSVTVGGREITYLAPNERQVGYVFQNYALFPHLSVADNVAYGLKVRRRPRAELRERVARALDLVALGALGDRYPSQLSGGQQQRVAIARALVLEPEVLLLDEPFNALDASLRLTMQLELRRLIERVGITSIFVTHDQAEAMALSDQVAVMRAGRVEQVAPPLELYDRPRTAYVADFIGRANLIEAKVAGGRVDAPGARSLPAGDAPDGTATLAVRPEHLALIPAADAISREGWQGRVSFATPLGAQVEYEVECGLPEPLRVIATRPAGAPVLEPGTPVTVSIADRGGAVVLSGEAARVG